MEYWLITAGDKDEYGIDGAFSRRSPENIITDTFGVDDVDEYMEKIEKAGGKLLTPKMPIPGVGYFAAFRDSEGNNYGIMEDDSDAK